MRPSIGPPHRKPRPSPRPRSNRAAVATGIAVALSLGAAVATPRSRADDYSKEFYANNVAALAGITAGAQTQTWSGNAVVAGSITYLKGNKPSEDVKSGYSHATKQTIAATTINGGFPITAV